MITDVVKGLSDAVVALRLAASEAPLTDGAIVIGPQHLAEESAPPRIVAIPRGWSTSPRDAAWPGVDVTGERATMIKQRALLTEHTELEVHCWGANTTGNTDDDFAEAQQLAHEVIQAAQIVAAGVFEIGPGQYNVDTPLTTAGREFVFQMTVQTPIGAPALDFPTTTPAIDQTITLTTPGAA